jgi:nucleoid-associated protein EbfC
MFDKMKTLMDMQKKMQEIKRELDNTNVEAEDPKGFVKITMSGSQEVRDIAIKKNIDEGERSSFEATLKDVFNKAIKRSQEVAAQKMKAVTGLNLPGL